MPSTHVLGHGRCPHPQAVRPPRQPRADPVQRAALRVRPGLAAAHVSRRRSRSSPTRSAPRARPGPHLVGGYIDGDKVDALRRDDRRSRLGQAEPDRLRRVACGDGAMKRLLLALLFAAGPGDAGAGRGAAADALLAADRLRAVRPQVHDGRPQGRRRQAPNVPGYVLGFQEQSLVDSKDPDAKPLPVNKMMVHHFLYYTRGRVDPGPGRVPGRRLPQRARGGAPGRALRRGLAARAAGALRRAQRDARRHGARRGR